jgi:hypothetical protein
VVLSGSLPLKVSILNFDLGPYFGYALSNTNIGGIYSEKYEKPLAMKVSNFFLQVERQVYPVQGLNYIYILHNKCCLA